MILRSHKRLSGGSYSNPLVAVFLWAPVLCGPAIRAAVVRQRDSTQFATIDSAAIIQAIVVGCALAALLFTGELSAILGSVWRSSAGAVLLYYVLCVVSSLWSPMPVYTLYRAIEFISMFVVVLIIINRSRDFYAAERRVILLSVWTIACGIVLNLRIQLSMVMLNGNMLTPAAAMIFCYCVGEAPGAHRSRSIYLIACAALALVYLAVARGSASIIATFCGFVVALWLLPRTIVKRCLTIGLFLVVSLFPWMLSDILFPGKADAQITSLHGRVYLWEQYAADFITSPILGRGFAVSSRLGDIYTTNTHNSVFAVLAGTGMVGMVVVLAGLARAVRESAKIIRAHLTGSIGCVAGLTAGLLNCLSAPVFLEQWHFSSVTFASVLAVHIFWLVPRANWQALGTTSRVCRMGSTYRPNKLMSLQRE